MAAGNVREIKGDRAFYGSIYAPGCDVHRHRHDNGQSFESVISDLLCFRHYAQGRADLRLNDVRGNSGSVLAR